MNFKYDLAEKLPHAIRKNDLIYYLDITREKNNTWAASYEGWKGQDEDCQQVGLFPIVRGKTLEECIINLFDLLHEHHEA